VVQADQPNGKRDREHSQRRRDRGRSRRRWLASLRGAHAA